MNKWLCILLCILLLFSGCTRANQRKEDSEPLIVEDTYLEQEADKIASEFTEGDYTLYYTNEDRTSLEEITIYFDFTSVTLSKEIESILNSLANIRDLEALNHTTAQSIIPEGLVTEYAVDENPDGNIVKIYMSEAYDQLPPNASVVLRTGINKAIYNLGLVSSIEYYVKRNDDAVLVDYSGSSEQVLLNQYDNNFYTDDVVLRLYFADENEEGLVMEERAVTLNLTDTMQATVVKELINGPQTEGTLKQMPEGTRVNSVWIKDGICYVDLSSEFQSRFIGAGQDEKLLIYSIVNSLGELTGIQYVQILIDGERVDAFYSDVSINSALTPDLELVITKEE